MAHMLDGDYNKSSDIDIMILVDLEGSERVQALYKVSDLAFEIELEHNIILSPIIKNIDYFNSWLDVKPFYANVVNEGVVLHG